MMMTIEEEKAKFEELGIRELHPFQLRELVGYFVVDCKLRMGYEVSRAYSNRYETLSSTKAVPGLYEHILDGTWHVA